MSSATSQGGSKGARRSNYTKIEQTASMREADDQMAEAQGARQRQQNNKVRRRAGRCGGEG